MALLTCVRLSLRDNIGGGGRRPVDSILFEGLYFTDPHRLGCIVWNWKSLLSLLVPNSIDYIDQYHLNLKNSESLKNTLCLVVLVATPRYTAAC